MSKSKRILSAFMAFVMLISVFSGLGGMFSTKAYAAQGVSSVKSYADLDAAHDTFVYLATEIYEPDADGNYALTDYYVDPGMKLKVQLYLKTDLYIGTGKPGVLFDNNFFDVQNGTGEYEKLTSISGNPDNADLAAAGFYGSASTGMLSDESAYKNARLTYPTKVVGDYSIDLADIAQHNVSYKRDTNDTVCYEAKSDAYAYEFYVTVREGLTDGTVGLTWIDPYTYSFAKLLDSSLGTGTGPFDVRTATDPTTAATSCKTLLALKYTLDNFLSEDAEHLFTIGKPSASKSYTATFMANGAEFDKQTVKEGAEYSAPATDPTSTDGSTFKGWALEGTTDIVTFPVTMGGADVTYVAIFEAAATYTATFLDKDGNQIGEAKEYKEGDTIEFPTAPTVTGYNFIGWTPDQDTMGTEDVEFTAEYAAKTYTATWNVDGKTSTTDATYDAPYILPETPVKEGYEFAGWLNADGADANGIHTIDGDVTFTADWDVLTFDAIFDLDGGNIDGDTANVVEPTEFGKEISVPADPTKEGYDFAGWLPTVPSSMPAADTTFVAQWTPKSASVIFMNGDEVYHTEPGVYGDNIYANAASTPAKEGYDFAGWVDADNKAITWPIVLGTEAVTVYASWTPKKFYVEYYAVVDGEMGYVAGGEENCGAPYAAPEVADYPGYTFTGWADAEGNAMPETVIPVQNQKYYAQYDKIEYSATFVVDGVTLEDKTVKGGVDDTIALIEAPAKTGYTFKYWTVNGTPVTGTTYAMPIGGVEFVAEYAVNLHTITWIVDGTVVYVQENVEYGSEIADYAYEAPEGKTFAGWLDKPATMPDADITVNGTCSSLSFTIIYNVNGEKFDERSYVYGEVVEAPAYEVPAGYTFSGWDVPASMPAENLVLDATLTLNNHKATYYLDDEKTVVHAEYDVDYNAAIPVPEVPSKPGYTFEGWSNADITVMPDNAVEFVAIWTAIDYTVAFVNEDGSAIDGYTYTEKHYGDKITAEMVPTVSKEGSRFLGWKVDGEGDYIVFPYEVTGDVTLKPIFGIESFIITWVVDGVTVHTDTLEFGDKVTEYDPGTKEGHKFSGWDKEIPATMPAEDLTISGTFDVQQYNAVFMVDGEVYDTVPTDFGKIPVAPADPKKDGYTFNGWTPALSEMTTDGAIYEANFSAGSTPYTVEIYEMDLSGEYQITDTLDQTGETDATVTYKPATKTGFTVADSSVLSGKVTADGKLVLVVKYSRNTYNLITVADGVETKTPYYYGATIGEIEEPVKEGYKFSGWDATVPATMPARDVTLNARFTINSYTITFNTDGGSAVAPITDNYGATIKAPADPTKEGYKFIGWDKEIPATMPAESYVITALWEINTYTITWVIDGEETPAPYKYMEKVNKLDDPVKEGYTFDGWDVEIPETMPAKDLKITAKFTVKSFNVTFTIDGVDKVVPTNFGEVPVIEEPSKLGHGFAGWYVTGDATETIVELKAIGAADEAYTAKFTVLEWPATFVLDGGNIGGDTANVVKNVLFGAKVEAPADPVKEGYTFAGWTPAVDTMNAEGIVYTAKWTQDLNYVRVKSVTRVTENVYGPQLAQYELKVEGTPVKIQFAYAADEAVTWTFDRNETPATAGAIGLVSVVPAAEEGFEIWTVSVILTEGNYKVRAKVDYSPSSWEASGYDYVCAYDIEEVAPDAPAPVQGVVVSADAVKLGEYATITVTTTADVTRIRLRKQNADGSFSTATYSTGSSAVTRTEVSEGTWTWAINVRFTYAEDVDSQVQNWVVWYRTDSTTYYESEYTASVTVTKKTSDTTVNPDTGYTAHTVISVDAPATTVKGEYAYVTVVTTNDNTRVRLVNGTKTVTYLKTSSAVTYTENAEAGTATWVIKYRFTTVGENQAWSAQCRGSAWSDAVPFTVTVTEA